MSCPKRNIRNMDTTIYRQTGNYCGCDDIVADVQSKEMLACCHPQNYSRPVYQVSRPCSNTCCPVFPPVHFPMPPMYPIPPSLPPVNSNPTEDYAFFYSAPATTATYTVGTSIPVSMTLYNTAPGEIINNASTVTLLGGATGRTYLLSYQVSGTNAGTTFGINVNGTVPANSYVTALDGDSTVSGRYIVEVPANSASTVSLQVVAGTLSTTDETASTNLYVLRIR